MAKSKKNGGGSDGGALVTAEPGHPCPQVCFARSGSAGSLSISETATALQLQKLLLDRRGQLLTVCRHRQHDLLGLWPSAGTNPTRYLGVG
jgi:hypothetical protein